MHDELLQFQRNNVWTLVPRPKGEHIIGTKWIFRNKTDDEGNVIWNKAHFVAQGYSQMEGVDYNEIFALVARIGTIRILLALACHLKFKVYQMDVKTVFLNGFLKEDVYVAQPKGFIDPHFPDHVLYLKKSLYSLNQAPRAWYDRLTQYLMSHGFTRGKADQTLFIKREDGELIVAQVYVNDIIFGSTKDELARSFSKLMQAEFKMSMIGELNHFLGLQIRQQELGIFLFQSKYARNLVKKFGFESASFVRTPMSSNVKLTIDLLGKSVDSSLYRSMIGSLLYFIVSRLDISYSMGVYARYQANPKKSHMITLKRIIKYVKTTAGFGVWYNKDTNDVLAGYSDADWAGNADNRKSISRGCFCMGDNLVSWMSKKQNSISLSTVEVEYNAAGSCCTQLLWMQKLLINYGIRQEHLTIYCDNTSAMNISKNLIQHSRTKHIKIRHHFIRELVEDGTLTLEFIHIDDQKADLFTKPLDSKWFEFLR